MLDHDDPPRQNQAASAPRSAGVAPGRATRLGLSIGSGVLSLAALHAPAFAGPCSASGVVLESPDGTTVIEADGSVSCIVLPGGDALLSLTGQVTPLVPLGAPRGTTTYTYDSVGQLPSENNSLGRTTLTYDYEGGRLASSSSPARLITTYTYDGGSNLLTSETLPGHLVTTYSYDANGNLLSERVAGTTYTFDYSSGDVVETGAHGAVTT